MYEFWHRHTVLVGVHHAHHIGARTSNFIRRTTPALEHRSSLSAPFWRSNIGVHQAHHSGARTSEFIRRLTQALEHQSSSGAPLRRSNIGGYQALRRSSSAPALIKCAGAIQAPLCSGAARAAKPHASPGISMGTPGNISMGRARGPSDS